MAEIRQKYTYLGEKSSPEISRNHPFWWVLPTFKASPKCTLFPKLSRLKYGIMSSSCIQAFSLVVFSIFFKNWRSVSKMRNVSKVEVTWHIKMHNKQMSEPDICNRVSAKVSIFTCVFIFIYFLNAESIGEGFEFPFSTLSLHRWTAKKVMTPWLSLRKRSWPTDGRECEKK